MSAVPPIGRSSISDPASFPFLFAPAYQWLAAPFGIGPDTARVTVTADALDARFGPWRVMTPLSNVVDVDVTGPYRLWRTGGPARYSLQDHGLTFATNGERGVCIGFAEAVPGLEPSRSLRHPTLTVTVTDVDLLAGLLSAREDTGSVVPLRGRTGRP